MKTTITAAVLAMSLISISSAFADETQSLVSDSSMQISKISMAQDFSAFDGVETFDVSKAELDEATGNGLFLNRIFRSKRARYAIHRSGIFYNLGVVRCLFGSKCQS